MRNTDDRYHLFDKALVSFIIQDNIIIMIKFTPSFSSNFLCRNRLLLCILNVCKDMLGRLPKVVGIDVVEMALWAKVGKITCYCIT